MNPVIEAGDIRRTKPRTFWQFGTATISIGDELTRYDWSTDRATSSASVSCRRAVTKAGKPRGPWLFIYANHGYRVESEVTP